MDEPKLIAAASDLPYPPVAVDGKNPAYAKAMLDNVGGANSEMSAISLYVYNNLRSGHTPDIAQTFHKVSIVEMHHLEIFGKLACMLGEDPRMWTQHGCKKAYWTPGYNQYPVHFPEMMRDRRGKRCDQKIPVSGLLHKRSQHHGAAGADHSGRTAPRADL